MVNKALSRASTFTPKVTGGDRRKSEQVDSLIHSRRFPIPTIPASRGTMSNATPATRALAAAGAAFTLHRYDYDPGAERVGLQAAEALGEPPHRVLKTLMALVDGKPVCAVVPSDREVAMKKLASASGGKSAEMMKPSAAERLTGYKVGGISPFGQRRGVPTFVEESALQEALVYVNGGQRGLQIQLDPQALLSVLGAVAAPLVA
jgi:Cys-tRNA(Pro)/Cys-tRNA(Cys) deacylase